MYGDWLPRHLFGKFTAFFAILRMIYLAIIVVLFYNQTSELVFMDGVSAPIPLLRLFGLKVLFYCHFPDKVGADSCTVFDSNILQLLCVDRSSLIKTMYRFYIDGLEEWTTGCSNLILVNSRECRLL